MTRVPRWTAGGRRFWLAMALVVPALGFLVGQWPVPTLVVFVVLGLTIGTVGSREFALGAILVSSLVMLSVNAWFRLPVQTALLTKALVGLFASTVLLDIGAKNPLRVPMPLIMLVVVLVVSALFGADSRFLAFQALASYVAGPLAYVAIVHSNITVRSLRRLAVMVLIVVMAQLPLVLLQARFTANVNLIGGI